MKFYLFRMQKIITELINLVQRHKYRLCCFVYNISVDIDILCNMLKKVNNV